MMNPMMGGMGNFGAYPGAGAYATGGYGSYSGAYAGASPYGSFAGAYSSGGGAYAGVGPYGAYAGVGGAGGSGQAAVDIGRRFLGQNAIDIRGQLPHFTAAGGQTNNCADFVSSCLESSGRIQGHHVNVGELEQSLLRQGWRQVPLSQARPGDVWINQSRGHTELVEGFDPQRGLRLIGSNNDRPGHQRISESGARGGIVYTRA
jgi:peptidoglycan DL-endopeptidase CwlO